MAADKNLKTMLISLVGLLLGGTHLPPTINIHGQRESAKIAEKNAIMQEKEGASPPPPFPTLGPPD